MSTHPRAGAPPAGRSRPHRNPELLTLAGLLMLVSGAWAALTGVSALAGDAVFDGHDQYLHGLDTSTWAWVRLALAALTAAVGIWVVRGGTGSRTTAVVVVALGAVISFLFAAQHPVWSVLGIALDLVVLWALTAGQRVG